MKLGQCRLCLRSGKGCFLHYFSWNFLAQKLEFTNQQWKSGNNCEWTLWISSNICDWINYFKLSWLTLHILQSDQIKNVCLEPWKNPFRKCFLEKFSLIGGVEMDNIWMIPSPVIKIPPILKDWCFLLKSFICFHRKCWHFLLTATTKHRHNIWSSH